MLWCFLQFVLSLMLPASHHVLCVFHLNIPNFNCLCSWHSHSPKYFVFKYNRRVIRPSGLSIPVSIMVFSVDNSTAMAHSIFLTRLIVRRLYSKSLQQFPYFCIYVISKNLYPSILFWRVFS